MNKTPKLLLVIATVLFPSLCWANITFILGNNPQPGEENVLLNKGTSGSTVQGSTNQSGVVVNFTSATQTLTEPANGQARIEATNGTSQVALTDISSISLAAGGFFDDIIFNMHIGGTIGTSGGTATISVVDNLGFTSTFSETLGNGQNFLTVVASAGESIDSVAISYPVGFTDLRQVRISGVTAVPDSGATLSLLGASLIGLAFLRHKLTA